MVPRALRRSNKRRTFQIPLHLILVVPFVLQLLGTVGVIGYLSFRNGQQSVENLANQLMEKEADRIEQELTTYLSTPQLINRLNANEVRLGQLTLRDMPHLEKHLLNQLLQFQSVDTVMFAGADGLFRSVTRADAANGAVAIGVADFSKQDKVDTYSVDSNGNKTSSYKRSSGLDVRRDRPWYKQAVKTGKPGWSPTFQLAFFDILAISAYYPVYDQQTGSLLGVFAVNTSLNQMSQFLKSLTQEQHKEIFIVESNGSLIASSADPTPFVVDRSIQTQLQFQRLKPTESQSLLIRETSEYIQNQLGDLVQLQGNQHLKMTQKGDSYLINVRPFRDQYGLDWRVITIAPDSAFMANIHANTRTTTLLCVAAVIASSAISFWLARCITHPLRRFNKISRRIAAGELETLMDHSPIAEVEEMAQSLQQMVVQLKTSLNAVETDKQHLSGQFDAFFQSAPAGMAIVDEQLRFVQINQQLADIDGHPITAYAGRTIRELLPKIAPAIEPLYQKVLETGQPLLSQEVSGEVPSQPGLLRHWLVSYFPLFSAEHTTSQNRNHPLQVGVVVIEISDRKRAEIALSESEAKFSTIFYANPDPAWIATFDEGRCLNANESFSQLLDYSCEEVIGRTCTELALWDNPQDLQHFRETLSREGKIQGLEVTWRRRSGEAKTVLLSARVSQLHGQACVIGAAKDITARKQIEAALYQSEAQNQAILRAIPDLMVRINRQGFYQGYIRTNNLIDLIPQDCDPVGHHIAEFLPPEQAVRQVESIQQVLDTGQMQIYEQKQFVNGRTQYEEVRVVAYKEDETLFLIRDITDRKQLELALQSSEARLNDVLNRALAAIISYRIYGDRDHLLATHFSEAGTRIDDWHYEFCSAGCKQVFGYTTEEFTAESLFWFTHVHPEDWKNILIPRYYKIFTDGISTDEYRFLHRDGTWHWISETVTSRWEEASQSWVVILISYDVSDRKQVELELQQAKEAAEAANLAKSIFLANMSHELRTPLNAILGFTELLSVDPAFNADQKENLSIIHSSGEHLLNLINDILDLSKIEAGRTTLNEMNVNLPVLLQSLRDMFLPRINGKKLRIILNVADNVPKFIRIDVQKLRQVLINLLANAVKFTERGQVILRTMVVESPVASLNSDETAPIVLCFEVEDTGIGIALEEQETIFDAFAQAQSERQVVEGTGLGLAISRRFVRLMGGELKVNSFPGEGSTFSFQLAVKIVAEPDDFPELCHCSVIGLAPGQIDYRILVVDDRPVNRHLLKTMLSRIGLEVRDVANGEAALQTWQVWQPHLIWMDLRMPIMDGYEATQRIREAEKQQCLNDRQNLANATAQFPRTIIIAVTAQAFTDAHELAIEAGCDDVVTKPIKESVILKKMVEHLGMQYQYAELMFQGDPGTNGQGPPASELLPDLQPEDLQVMPPQWVESLHKAALTCYTQDIDLLIEQIPPEHANLISGLKRLNYEYEYDTLIRLSRS